jgi:Xaa-Pro aminopeptidase
MAPPKTPDQLKRRVRAVQRRLTEEGHDALLVSNPVDIRYLTGFVGDDSCAIIERRKERPTVVSDFRFNEQIGREAPHVAIVMRTGAIADTIARTVRRLRIKKLAVQSASMTLQQRKALVRHLGASRVRPWDDGLLMQRAVKDEDELRSIRKAVSIQQRAFREMLKFIEPGKTEAEVCAYLEYRVRALGADCPSFPSIIAADANAALPHAIPGKTKVRAGGILLVDWGAKVNGYCSDMTRVIALGKMKPKLREIYKIVLDAQTAAIDAIAPGKRLKDIDAVARQIIAKAGYGDQFGHGLGHGIGYDIHEQPVLSSRSKGVLEPGQIVTVEPGIYLPGVGGVRIEDDVLVTARGRRVLCDLPKGLDSAII